MDLSAALGGDLTALSRATGVDQHRALAQLSHGLQVAVPSYLGLAITIVTSGQPVTLAANREKATEVIDVRASLHFSLALLTTSDPMSTLTVYAGRAGAFVDLAADLGWLVTPAGTDVQLDRHLSVRPADGDPTLADFSSVNQAAGVLIAAGFGVADAYAELRARAERTGCSTAEAARQVLAPQSDGDT
ncbi:MAG: ANTAR domain-containing protein [Jatrophihabitantaceae bacterium]